MKVTFVLRFIVAALALVVALDGGPALSQEPPYEINAVLSLSGPAAALGAKEAEAFHAIEVATNKAGGIRGRPLKFVIGDDQTNPQVALQLVNALVAKGVPLIMGPTVSATCNAVAPLVAAGPLVYCLSAAVHPTPGSFMFAATASSTDLVSALMQYARSRRWRRLGLMTTTDATGQDIARQIDALVTEPLNRGLQIVVRETFNPADISVNAQMSHVKAVKPDALLTSATGTPFATILHGIQDVGLDLPVFANGSNMTFTQMTQYAAFLPAELYFTGDRGMAIEGRAAGAAVRGAQLAFFDALRAGGARPDFGHLLAWDAAAITIDLLKQLGTGVTAAQLHDALARLQGWSGICGGYDFRRVPQRGVGIEASIIYRWDPAKGEFAAISKPGGSLR